MNPTRAQARRVALRTLVAVFTAASLSACESVVNLDESAETFISPDQFYKSDAQAAIAVNGIYAPLMGWNGWKQPAQHSIMCDDNEMLCWNWMGGGFSGNAAGQWYMQDNSTWFGDYQIIQRANDVIVNVARSDGITPAMKETATGQALFARAYAYFDLVRRFGGVPMRLEPYVPDAQLGARERSPVDVVYQQIAKDLREAAALLPESYASSNGQGLPRQASAWGLLAKVYLHMAGEEVAGTPLAAARNAYLDSAMLAAQMVMQDPTVALEPNYMDLFDVVKQNTSPEILFAVQGAATGLNGSNIPAFATPRGDCTLVGGCGQGFLSVREDFYRTFEAGDERAAPGTAIARSWEVSMSPLGRIDAIHTDSIAALWAADMLVEDIQFRWESWTEGCGAFGHRYDSLVVREAPGSMALDTLIRAVGRPVYSLKYIDRSAAGGSEYANANNFIILRYADVLLVYAEAAAMRTGATAEAIAAVDLVRDRAGLDPLAVAKPDAITSQDAFLAAVRQERAHELYGEFHGRFDLIRQGRWLEVMNAPSTVTDFAAHGICRPRQEYQTLLPIPQRELAANPLIDQNPGY